MSDRSEARNPIEVVQIHPARSDHHLAFPPPRHYSDSCKARKAARVFWRPRRCPYRRVENAVKIATRSSMRSLTRFSAVLTTSLLNGQAVNSFLMLLPCLWLTIIL
jgi:hypothetical protein